MATDDAFKSSFINRDNELEVDKLFRACVKLEGERPAPEGRQAADGARRRHAAADESRPDRRRGDGAAHASR